MSSNLNANYQLITDIDCSVISNFKPVGNCTGNCFGGDDDPFTGNFSGNGNSISDLTIINNSGTGNWGWGLFGYIDSTYISNINLENVSINVTNYFVGSLVGYSANSSVSNSSASGYVIGDTGVGGLVGGLVGGDHRFSLIVNSYFSGSVTGNNKVGGLFGSSVSDDVNITNSSSSGFVTGNDSVGGLAGYVRGFKGLYFTSSNSTVIGNNNTGGLVGFAAYTTDVRDSYSTSTVIGNISVGGLIGKNEDSSSSQNAEVLRSYSTGNVFGITYVGGLVGLSGWESNIKDSYSTSNVNGSDYVGGLIGYHSLPYSSFYINNSYSTGNVNGINYVGGLIGRFGGIGVSNSFTISNVIRFNTSNTGSFIGELVFGIIINNYWNNISGNPTNSVGNGSNINITPIQNNLEYFYDNTNTPFVGNWESPTWYFTGTNPPSLIGVDPAPNSLMIDNSVSSLFPLGSIYIPLTLIIVYFLF